MLNLKITVNSEHTLVFGDATYYFAWYNASIIKRFWHWLCNRKSTLMIDALKLKKNGPCATAK